jgi:hypothetical protein
VIGLQYFLLIQKATNLVLLKPIFVISNTNTGITTEEENMVRPKFNDQETFVILWFCTFICFSAFGQEKLQPTELGKTKVDSLYREDQFYLGLNYNTLLNKPVGISQQKSL